MSAAAGTRPVDRTGIAHLRLRLSLMSNETLREIAKGRGFDGAAARRELAGRDHEMTFGTTMPSGRVSGTETH